MDQDGRPRGEAQGSQPAESGFAFVFLAMFIGLLETMASTVESDQSDQSSRPGK
jgi:hypothetical protein